MNNEPLQTIPRHVAESSHWYRPVGPSVWSCEPVYEVPVAESWFLNRGKDDLYNLMVDNGFDADEDNWAVVGMWGESWQTFKKHFSVTQKRFASDWLMKNANVTRPPTITDAREHGWLPGWSSVASMIRKPGLERWKLGEMFEAAATCPRLPDESDKEYTDKVWREAEAKAREAADRGTRLHAAIQSDLLGERPTLNDEIEAGFEAYKKWARDHHVQPLRVEAPFANREFGIGGKIDLVAQVRIGDCAMDCVVDFKTQGTKGSGKIKFYPEWCNQLMAYRDGAQLTNHCVVSVGISTDEPGLLRMQPWTAHEMNRAEKMVKLMIQLWQLDNDYYPHGA